MKNILKKTTFKIALIVTFFTLILFLVLNIFILNSSEKAFIDTIEKINTQLLANRGLTQRQMNILRFLPDGSERTVPLQKEFVSIFRESLIWTGLLTGIFSFISGFIVAKVFITPIKTLKKAVINLRNNKYTQSLSLVGTEEIDDLISEFNHLTKKLAETEELRKDMISDTSHELKTPITSIAIQLEGIRDGVIPFEKERIDKILESVKRLDNLVNMMQDFTRIRAKIYSLDKRKVFLADIIKEQLDLYKVELEQQNMNTDIHISENSFLDVDQSLFERVLANIISNAIKYSKASMLKFTFIDKKIVISDNGVGIPKEDLPFIFERFYRVEKSRNRKTGGLGLGLSIVKEIVEAHNWQIKVRSSKKGTKFIIYT